MRTSATRTMADATPDAHARTQKEAEHAWTVHRDGPTKETQNARATTTDILKMMSARLVLMATPAMATRLRVT